MYARAAVTRSLVIAGLVALTSHPLGRTRGSRSRSASTTPSRLYAPLLRPHPQQRHQRRQRVGRLFRLQLQRLGAGPAELRRHRHRERREPHQLLRRPVRRPFNLRARRRLRDAHGTQIPTARRPTSGSRSAATATCRTSSGSIRRPTRQSAAVPANRTDARSVFLHEFGHAFAFNGWRDGQTGALPGSYQSTFDCLVTTSSFQGQPQLFFTGSTCDARSTAEPCR